MASSRESIVPTKASTKPTPRETVPEEPPDVQEFMRQVNPTITDESEPEFEEDPIMALGEPVPTVPAVYTPRQHTNVGVGALAAMSDEEFERNLATLQKGQERLTKLHQTLMVKGTDYGTVPGIPRPFLHKPGAEKLAQFYGLVLRFEADRIIGEWVVGADDDGMAVRTWLSPPLAYHVRAYAHLGSFDGPIVAQGYGEANVWEEKHRYRNEKPTCPQCGRPGLIKRVKPPALAGKWQCPGWGDFGGCGTIYEAGDPTIKSGGKIENENPYDLANTLIKMAEKRASTDVVLRATNTSGLYSQDDDSPSVQAQSAGAAGGADIEVPTGEPPIETLKADATPQRTKATKPQIDELARISREKDLGPERVAEIVTRVTGQAVELPDTNRRAQSTALINVLGELWADDLGKVLQALTTGEVPNEEATPGWPPQDSDDIRAT